MARLLVLAIVQLVAAISALLAFLACCRNSCTDCNRIDSLNPTDNGCADSPKRPVVAMHQFVHNQVVCVAGSGHSWEPVDEDVSISKYPTAV